MAKRMKRRAFLRSAACGGAGMVILANSRSARSFAANDKLNIALIGVGGRGRWFVDTIPKMANVTALCDVDDRKTAAAFKRWADLAGRFATSKHSWEKNAAPTFKRLAEAKVKTFHDFRKMLDEMGKEIDGVVISIPDHTHGVASAAAIKADKHVYCEKPLTRTVRESHDLRRLARKHKVATSMGNQGTASGPFRRALELIRDGSLGEIKEVHVWNTGGGADRKAPPKGTEPVPKDLKWDLWLGPAADRPYHREWLRRNMWRDFGTCQLGNWASHTANLAFMALNVHTLWEGPPCKPSPIIRVEAKSSGINRLSFPRWEIVKWHIPSRRILRPITFTWYNGAAPGAFEAIDPLMGPGETPERKSKRLPFAGALIVGTRGTIHTTGHNATFRLLPQERFRGVETARPEKVDSSRGHEMDWLIACRGGKPAWANFDYASALNEFLMLGNVATQFEAALEFYPQISRMANNQEADRALYSECREGWAL